MNNSGERHMTGKGTETTREYAGADTLEREPFRQFEAWLKDAEESGIPHPETMVLATASSSGKPSARIVLLKGCDENGFVFYTNYESRKAVELSENPQASLLFYWEELARQIRVEGLVEKTSREETRRYFATRPFPRQLGSWASRQGRVIEGREVLEDRLTLFRQLFGEAGSAPPPPYWGGFRLIPSRFEYWMGRDDRLHDRFCYEKGEDGWTILRLSP